MGDTQATVTEQTNSGDQVVNTDEGKTPSVETVDTPPVIEEPKETPEWAKKRFGELTAKQREAERKAEEKEREAQFYKELAMKNASSAPAAPPQEPQPVVLKEPKVSDFDDYSQYIEAKTDYLVAKKLEESEKAKAAHAEQARVQRETEQRVGKFAESVKKFKEKNPDYEAVVLNPSLPFTQVMFDTCLVSEKGAELAYHIGKNPDVAARLARLSPVEAVREMGLLEAKLNPPDPKLVTQAPEPVKTLNGNGDVVQKDPAKMSMEEYAAYRADALKWKGRK